MRRTNRRHTRAIERKRRNTGPELFSQVADKELQNKAIELVTSLSNATINNGSAAAASLLIEMAESAEWGENPAACQRVLSLAEKWAKEPPFVAVEILKERKALGAGARQLTDGSTSDPEDEDDEVIEGEVVEEAAGQQQIPCRE